MGVIVFYDFISEVTSITFTLFCLLEASHKVEPLLKGKRLAKGLTNRKWGIIGDHVKTAYHTQNKIPVKKS